MNRFLAVASILLASSSVSGCAPPVMLASMMVNDVVGAIQTELERSEPMQEGVATDEDGGGAPVPVETASSSIADPSTPVSEDGRL